MLNFAALNDPDHGSDEVTFNENTAAEGIETGIQSRYRYLDDDRPDPITGRIRANSDLSSLHSYGAILRVINTFHFD